MALDGLMGWMSIRNRRVLINLSLSGIFFAVIFFSFSRSSKAVSGETVCWEGGQLVGRQTYPLKPIKDLIEFARHMPLNNLMN